MSIELQTFKAGDEVYCPQITGNIYKLLPTGCQRYQTRLEGIGSFTANGLIYSSNKNPFIFHATPENKTLLESLYKCKLEAPKLRGSDLTRKLLSEGKHVLCYVSDVCDLFSIDSEVMVIQSYNELYFKSVNNSWKYAVPCNDYANLTDGILIKSEQ